jgi:tetratricopeptide (TPR) repeat protein
VSGTGAGETTLGVPTISRGVPAIWGSVPPRNKNFTGRESLLEELRHRLTGGRLTGEPTAVLPHALQGLGGVGKTQLAIEYAYRYAADYDLVWWIPADQTALIRSELAALAPRLGLTGIAPERVEDGLRAVLDSLRRGEPSSRWLLIFDNADQPETLRDVLPTGLPTGGDVLVTSRNHRWQSVVDAVEVDVFTREESVEFLRRRVPGSQDEDSEVLAEELGDLPLALEQAGALQAETGMSVADYLRLLKTEARKLLTENAPTDYPWPVAAAWSLSMAQVGKQMPFALELLRLCAFFGPEPIPRDLLQRGQYVLDSPLRDALGDPIIVSRGMRELGRYALAKLDNNRKTVQVHRLIQRLLREELTEDQARAVEREVHLLLAAADPQDADSVDNWPKYRDLLAHAELSKVAESKEPPVRRLAKNLIDYLYYIGDYTTCKAEIERALANRADTRADDRDFLIVLGQKAMVLWALGEYREAAAIRRDILARATSALGVDDEYTLHTTNGYGADLRAEGKFAEALELDQELLVRHRRVLGPDPDPSTFMVAYNLGIDYCLNSDYRRATEIDEQNYTERLDFYQQEDHPWVLTSLGAIARDLRLTGRYADAVQTSEKARAMFLDIVRQRRIPENHPWVLLQAKDHSVALRKIGAFEEALDLAEDVYRQHDEQLGTLHPETLGAAINLGNAQRLADHLKEAFDRMDKTVRRYGDVWGPEHPFTHGCWVNLAIIERLRVHLDVAHSLLQRALAGLERTVGPDHHFTLTCLVNLATTTAEGGDVQAARQIGEQALARLRARLGEDHPHSLACAANLALDLQALGHHEEAETLAADTRERHLRTLGEKHPDVQAEIHSERLTIDFEPPEV